VGVGVGVASGSQKPPLTEYWPLLEVEVVPAVCCPMVPSIMRLPLLLALVPPPPATTLRETSSWGSGCCEGGCCEVVDDAAGETAFGCPPSLECSS
jgi:hypothetical protein